MIVKSLKTCPKKLAYIQKLYHIIQLLSKLVKAVRDRTVALTRPLTKLSLWTAICHSQDLQLE